MLLKTCFWTMTFIAVGGIVGSTLASEPLQPVSVEVYGSECSCVQRHGLLVKLVNQKKKKMP